MIVHLKTHNLSLCFNQEHLKTASKEYLKINTENYIFAIVDTHFLTLLKSEINENNILTSGKTHVTWKKLW